VVAEFPRLSEPRLRPCSDNVKYISSLHADRRRGSRRVPKVGANVGACSLCSWESDPALESYRGDQDDNSEKRVVEFFRDQLKTRGRWVSESVLSRPYNEGTMASTD
jgi:hypothetical protein